MKPFPILLLAIAISNPCLAETDGAYTNFIRQVQLPSGVQWDASCASAGETSSPLPVDLGGARFELWTVRSTPLTSYLLDTRYVSAYAPVAEVVIHSEDPYPVIPRTRADRPFVVEITTQGLLNGVDVPQASKEVTLLRHVQSYGEDGNGENLDRNQARLLSKAMISDNGTLSLSYSMTSVPSGDLTKARGEERFSIYSLEEENKSPELQIASKSIQIWPVADGLISGISPGQVIQFATPQVTFTLNDLYPESQTYAQVYPGGPKSGVAGKIIPGSSVILNEAVAIDRVLVLDAYDQVFDQDGTWTMELLTVTPFGIDRLTHVTFEIDRTIELRGVFSTLE